jgi:hypothetical protein
MPATAAEPTIACDDNHRESGVSPGPDWDNVVGLLGTMQQKVDGFTIEREARAE